MHSHAAHAGEVAMDDFFKNRSGVEEVKKWLGEASRRSYPSCS